MTNTKRDLNYESFLNSENASYLEQLQKKHTPENIGLERSWKDYFDALNTLDPEKVDIKISPTWLRQDWPPSPTGDFISALDGQWNLQDEHDFKNKSTFLSNGTCKTCR